MAEHEMYFLSGAAEFMSLLEKRGIKFDYFYRVEPDENDQYSEYLIISWDGPSYRELFSEPDEDSD